MGVTKQAAQKRFVPKDRAGLRPRPERRDSAGSPSARTQRGGGRPERGPGGAATPRSAPSTSSSGCWPSPTGSAARAIAAQGVLAGGVRQAATAALPPRRSTRCPRSIPFDATARKALELTFREALRLGHNYIGTEHILLALLEVEDGIGVLTGLGIDKAAAEENIAANLDAIVAAREKE